MDANLYSPLWASEHALDQSRQDDRWAMMETSKVDVDPLRNKASINVAEFVERVFVPGYVMGKRTAGRAHFQAILKHILSPERAAQAFSSRGKSRLRLSARPAWPYLDNIRISDVQAEHVARLIEASISLGYSAQMVTHVRNVIRSIFTHAAACGYFTGPNPATVVTVPSIAHKAVLTLTLPQLKQAFELMRYPERHIALFALLSDIHVTEVCGLKWKWVNLSNDRHYVSGELLPARTVAIKMQSYRGEYSPVVGARDRMIKIPDMLHSTLLQLKQRAAFVSGEDFVLVSRRGTAINPDNFAARRLKWIERSLDLHGLSWKVFHRTGIALQEQFGRYTNMELEKALHASGRKDD